MNPTVGAVPAARRRIVEAAGARFDDSRAEDFELLVSELLTNAVRHGGDQVPVDVILSEDPAIKVEVISGAPQFAPTPRGLDEVGGFGLNLVGQMADRWGLEIDRATRVWFGFDR